MFIQNMHKHTHTHTYIYIYTLCICIDKISCFKNLTFSFITLERVKCFRFLGDDAKTLLLFLCLTESVEKERERERSKGENGGNIVPFNPMRTSAAGNGVS